MEVSREHRMEATEEAFIPINNCLARDDIVVLLLLNRLVRAPVMELSTTAF